MAQVPAAINAAEAALDNLQREVQPMDQQGAVQNEPAEAVAQVNAVRNNFHFSGVFCLRCCGRSFPRVFWGPLRSLAIS